MLSSSKVINALLIIGIALCMLQVWLPDYYLTCDGPCHLYNARIVHDLWRNSNADLYHRFFDLVYTPDPNSMATFVLAALLYVAKGAVAEKLFLTAYVAVYIGGFCALIRKVSSGNNVWQLAVFIFLFTYALSKGFYNFSFGVAFYFWMVWSWIRVLDGRGFRPVLLFFAFSAFSFFTHLLPFVFGAFTCGSLLLSYVLALGRDKGSQTAAALFARKGLALLAVMVPFAAMALMFTNSEGGLQLQLGFHPYRLLELVEFKYIINLVDGERLWAAICGVVLTLLFLVVLVRAVPGFKLNKYDGFLLSLLLVGFVYVFFPEDFMGRAIIVSIRAQLFVFIIIVCIIAYRLPERAMGKAGVLVIYVCFFILSVYRINCRQEASRALADCLSVNNLIKPGSVLLPLDFAPSGRDLRGNPISGRNAIFHHAAQYLAADKPLILMDNYEANTGYFPIRWRTGVNPYNHLSTGAGFEGEPPSAAIEEYRKKTGVVIDYVLFWCYDPALPVNSAFKELHKEISSLYHLVYVSEGSRTMLFERNN